MVLGQGKAVLIQTTYWRSGDSAHRAADTDASISVDRCEDVEETSKGRASL